MKLLENIREAFERGKMEGKLLNRLSPYIFERNLFRTDNPEAREYAEEYTSKEGLKIRSSYGFLRKMAYYIGFSYRR